mgnify:CR=1 FL=1
MHDTTMRGDKLRRLTGLDEYPRQSRSIHVDRKINAVKCVRRLRDECLNREVVYTLNEARGVVEDWGWKYNHLRPHRSLGYISSIEFEQKLESESSTQGKASSTTT